MTTVLGYGVAAAGRVDRGAAHRQLAHEHALALGQRRPRTSAPRPGLGDGAHVGDRHLEAARARPGRARRAPRRARRRSRAAARRRPRRGAPRSSRSAASPRSRTASTIPRHVGGDRRPRRRQRPHRAASASRVLGRRPARRRSARHAAAPRPSSIAAALSLCATGLAISRAVDDRDLLAHDEAVLAQRRAGRGEVDDRLDQAGQRRELDRALDLDDLGLAAGALEVAASRSAGTSSRRARRRGGAAPRRPGRARPRRWRAPSGSARSRGRAARRRRARTAP